LPPSVDILNLDRPKRIVIVASNTAVSGQTGSPIGFWWAELAHPFWEFTGRGLAARLVHAGGIAGLAIQLEPAS
jgi:hypothetical protein